jgi:glycerol-3-phosphate acyltransferase PlsY
MPVVTGGVVAALLVIERHRGNLARLRDGTERRLGQRI